MRFAKRYDQAVLTNNEDGFDWVIARDGVAPRSFRPGGAPTLRQFENDGDGYVGDWLERHLLTRRHCPFCNRRTAFCEIDTVAIDDKSWPEGRRPEDSTSLDLYGDDTIANELSRHLWGDAAYQFWACACGYWQCAYIDMQGPSLEGVITTSKLATFNETLPTGVQPEVARALARRERSLATIPPRQLEQLVAAIFRANYEHVEVRHVGRPGDGGIDVILVESTNAEWLVQVKHHVKPKSAESVTAVRHLLGTLVLEQQVRGVVVSTADHFSYFASKAAGRAQSLGYQVELVDRDLLLRLLNRCMTDDGWLAPLREGKLFYFVKPDGYAILERYFHAHFNHALAPTMQLELFGH